jgi:hypothetical protein
VPERSKGAVLKIAEPVTRLRGFESHPRRCGQRGEERLGVVDPVATQSADDAAGAEDDGDRRPTVTPDVGGRAGRLDEVNRFA